MKKLLLLPFVLLTLANPITMASGVLAEDNVNQNFCNFFNGTYKVTSSVRNSYSGKTYTVIDEVSSSGKTKLVKDNNDNILSSNYVISVGGIAKEQYLDISNNIRTRDVSDTPILFNDYFASPLAKVTSNKDKIVDYFDIESKDNKVIYAANKTGLEKVSNVFSSFFSFVEDDYSWDVTTVKETLNNLTITCDTNGNPSEMSFKKIKKDRYGSIAEIYSSTLEKVETISSLNKDVYSGSEESKTRLVNALNSLSTELGHFNFSQTINLAALGDYSTYKNYYDFDSYGNGLMICDIPFAEPTYGKTYIGMTYSELEGGYYMIGISPESDYYASTSSDVESSLFNCIPLIRYISVDHFEYDETSNKYTFDLDKFMFNDYEFSIQMLKTLFGTNDPIAFKFGYYFKDTKNYVFDFHSLDIEINSEEQLTFTLNFVGPNGKNQSASTTFSDFGTVDLSTHPELSSAYHVVMG